MLKAKHKPQVL